ncbi:hypothetical protein WOLCODRAFT_19986 [Wolfiporia cocos MD-104 SS10]|uniref:Uncharacterized protein n=1 Tax=Wolfiporia cocos (strain MD-104) TaxID=742152 RepID=A0A2H3JHI5_WOLCO|nr:hypothetical protein WOLCODRAFT_19986 [Wolfiporia cocos MD-104 SS10]
MVASGIFALTALACTLVANAAVVPLSPAYTTVDGSVFTTVVSSPDLRAVNGEVFTTVVPSPDPSAVSGSVFTTVVPSSYPSAVNDESPWVCLLDSTLVYYLVILSFWSIENIFAPFLIMTAPEIDSMSLTGITERYVAFYLRYCTQEV